MFSFLRGIILYHLFVVDVRRIRSHLKDHVLTFDLYMRRGSGTTVPFIHIEVEIKVSIDVHINFQRRVITVTIDIPIPWSGSPRGRSYMRRGWGRAYGGLMNP
jgi:hypothetical protein